MSIRSWFSPKKKKAPEPQQEEEIIELGLLPEDAIHLAPNDDPDDTEVPDDDKIAEAVEALVLEEEEDDDDNPDDEDDDDDEEEETEAPVLARIKIEGAGIIRNPVVINFRDISPSLRKQLDDGDLQETAVYVGRPTQQRLAKNPMHYGNPFTNLPEGAARETSLLYVPTREDAVWLYECWLLAGPNHPVLSAKLSALKVVNGWRHLLNGQEERRKWICTQLRKGALTGRNLVCWCSPQGCHGDILLKWAASYGNGMSIERSMELDIEKALAEDDGTLIGQPGMYPTHPSVRPLQPRSGIIQTGHGQYKSDGTLDN